MASRERHVRTYLAGAALSYIGTAIVPVAMSFAVLDSGHGAGALGLVLAAQTAPTIVLLLLGGIAGDRWSRRGIMISADLFRVLAQAVLSACLIFGHASLALMVVVAALIGIGNAFFQPASSGFLIEIVDREQLARTNGLLRTANALAMVLGPSLGGAVVAASCLAGASPWTRQAISRARCACCPSAFRPERRQNRCQNPLGER